MVLPCMRADAVLRLDKSVFGGISVKRKELTWDDEKLLGLMLAA